MKLITRLNILTVFVSIIMLSGCLSDEQKRLRDEVADFDSKCPVQIIEGVTIDNVTYEDDYVTYYATINTPMIPIGLLSSQEAILNRLMVEAIRRSNDPKVNEQIKLCQDAGATITFVISSGDSDLAIEIDPDQVFPRTLKDVGSSEQ